MTFRSESVSGETVKRSETPGETLHASRVKAFQRETHG